MVVSAIRRSVRGCLALCLFWGLLAAVSPSVASAAPATIPLRGRVVAACGGCENPVGIPGVRVTIQDGSLPRDYQVFATTDANGNWSVPDAPVDGPELWLSFDAPSQYNSIPLDGSQSIPTISGLLIDTFGFTFVDAGIVELTAAVAPGRLFGRVVTPDGFGAPGVSVVTRSHGSQLFIGHTTDDDGYFDIDEIAGHHEIRFVSGTQSVLFPCFSFDAPLECQLIPPGGELELNVVLDGECLDQSITVDLRSGDVPTAGPDVIWGTSGNDVIDGLGGDDRVCGGPGDDIVQGGSGVDQLMGNSGNDIVISDEQGEQLFGGSGADQVYGWGGNDNVLGGSTTFLTDVVPDGADYLWGGDGVDTFNGHDGDDWLEGGAEGEVMAGGYGNDIVLGHGGDDTLHGDLSSFSVPGGADYLWGGPGVDSYVGGPGDDYLDGGDEGESMNGGSGNDTILGAGGTDTLIGNDGSDYLWGGPGVDTFHGDLVGNASFGVADHFDGDEAAETMFGGGGNDIMVGLGGADVLHGESGSDYLGGGAGTNTLNGGADVDYLDGGADADALDGGDGDDIVLGRAGNDTMQGGGGADYLVGEAGADALAGGAGGPDHCEGGPGGGADNFDPSCEVTVP